MDSSSQMRRAVRFGASQSDLGIVDLPRPALITKFQEKTLFDPVKLLEYHAL